VRRGTRETSGTEKEGVERVPRLVIGREVPSAVRTERGKLRERREDNAEESQIIWKEAPKSKTHEEVPDGGDGGLSVRETAVTEPAVPIEEEEPEVANMRLSVTISCAERDEPEEGGRVSLKEAGPYLTSSCSNQSRGALASDNSHIECEEGEGDLHHERGDLHCHTMSDPYHQEE
jgi:hypothetical protein